MIRALRGSRSASPPSARISVAAVIAFVVALPAPAFLHAAQAFDAREVALLPPYCKYSTYFREGVPGGSNPAETERWARVLGSSFNDIHHYCFGLMAANRAATGNPQQRVFELNTSVREFDYVIDRASSDFMLLPEILWRKGESLIRLGRAPQAVLALQRAVELKQDYWPPYATMSDFYRDTGDLVKARQWLEKGLTAAPNAKPLTRRLAELDASQGKRKAQ